MSVPFLITNVGRCPVICAPGARRLFAWLCYEITAKPVNPVAHECSWRAVLSLFTKLKHDRIIGTTVITGVKMWSLISAISLSLFRPEGLRVEVGADVGQAARVYGEGRRELLDKPPVPQEP